MYIYTQLQEVKQLLAAHEWLVAEEPKFNQNGTPYDFKQLRPESRQEKLFCDLRMFMCLHLYTMQRCLCAHMHAYTHVHADAYACACVHLSVLILWFYVLSRAPADSAVEG